MTTSQTGRAQRADARQNRERLLVAATELFATRGTDVSLEAVARQAGVGIGTLYRHFPTRDALIEAAYRTEVRTLTDAAPELLASHAPDEALALWLDRFVSYATTKRGMGSALKAVMAARAELSPDVRSELVAATALLLDAGAAAGSIRSDVTGDDVLRAMGGIWTIPEEAWPDQAQLLLRILMDGLRRRA